VVVFDNSLVPMIEIAVDDDMVSMVRGIHTAYMPNLAKHHDDSTHQVT